MAFDFLKTLAEKTVPTVPPVMPAAVIEYPATRGSKQPAHSGCPDTLARTVLEAWDVKKQIDILKDRLAGLNAQIEQAVDCGQAVVLEHTCRATRVLRQTVQITKPDVVLAYLGEQRFSDLVDEKTSYTPTVKFKGLLEDDPELQAALAEALTVSEASSVQYRAVA